VPRFASRMSSLGVEGAFIVLAKARELERERGKAYSTSGNRGAGI